MYLPGARDGTIPKLLTTAKRLPFRLQGHVRASGVRAPRGTLRVLIAYAARFLLGSGDGSGAGSDVGAALSKPSMVR